MPMGGAAAPAPRPSKTKTPFGTAGSATRSVSTCSFTTMSTDAATVSPALSALQVRVAEGVLQGGDTQGVRRFLGVPYAAAPVSDRRFKAPAPHPGWQGVRDATLKGPNAPQHATPSARLGGMDLSTLVDSGWVEGDEFLALNIWTPEGDVAGLPVMVFVHGGGFLLGSKDAPIYDGTAFAQSGVVLVAINYRMGLEGFAPVEGGDSNLGLRDQIAAFRWVKDNVAAFGGDPGNITVFGESAGAMSIADLIASPLAQGLFRRAIVQSGHGAMVRPKAVAERLTRKLAKILGVTPDEAGFRSKSVKEGVAAVAEVALPTTKLDLRDSTGFEPAFGISKFLPWVDGEVLPEPPMQALAKGVGKDIDLLIGSNSEEMNLYFVPTGVRGKLNRILSWLLLRRVHPKARDLLKAYAKPGKTPGHVFTEALTDAVFRWPSRRFAEAHQGRTHVYDFEWRSPACGGELGACHAVELPFVFKTLPVASGEEGFLGAAPPQELADRMHALWVGFARDGSLPWGEYSRTDRQVYRMAAGEAAVEAPMPAAPFLP